MIYLILFQIVLFVVLLLAILFRRCLLLAILHFGACLLCVQWTLWIYNPGSPVSRALGLVLYALALLPLGWILAVFRLSEWNAAGILLLNSFVWAGLAEWLLRHFVDPQRSPGAE